jgi:hypothetical protein
VWLVESYPKLCSYRRDREVACNTFPDVRGTDCFHDGQKMLDVVRQRHKILNESLRTYDFITGKVLDMIESMLHDEGSRAKSRTFGHSLNGYSRMRRKN